MPAQLSDHFTLEELVFSQVAARKGFDNTPTPEIRRNLKQLAALLEEVRTLLGAPMRISSGYRCKALNTAIGGARNSAHLYGLAADFTAPAAGTVLAVAKRIAKSDIQYDQLIYEYGRWIHIGLNRDGDPPRRENLSKFEGTGYLSGIVSHPS